MSNLLTDKYSIFIVNTELMDMNELLQLQNANYTLFESDMTTKAENEDDFSDDMEKAINNHEQMLEELKELDKPAEVADAEREDV
jgi:hypothetical protein